MVYQVAILGGGPAARLLRQAGLSLGVDLHVVNPAQASQVSDVDVVTAVQPLPAWLPANSRPSSATVERINDLAAVAARLGITLGSDQGLAETLAISVVRSPSGQAVVYPVTALRRSDGAIMETITPAPGLDDAGASRWQQVALQLAQEVDLVGVCTVEAIGDELLAARLGPGPEGFWSIDGAVTSQLHNHLRAVLDVPLGTPELRAAHVVSGMVYGGNEADLTGALQHIYARDRAIAVHLYGLPVIPGQHVGHVTATDHDLTAALRRSRHAAGYLMGRPDA